MKINRLLMLCLLTVSLGIPIGCGNAESPGTAGKEVHGHQDEHEHDHEATGNESEHGEEVKLSAGGAKKADIRIEVVSKHLLVEMIHAPARVVFNVEAMAHVGSPLSGRVSEIKIKVGDKVQKGDALLIVQSPDLGQAQSDYLFKRMAVETAGPLVELTRAAHERVKALHAESQGISLTEVQRREAEYKTALASQLGAQAEVIGAENRLHLLGMDQQAVDTLKRSQEIAPHYTVRAPIDGQVIAREVTLGELVHPEREALLILADLSTLWVVADVPESQISQIAPGVKAQVAVPALAGKPLEGTVTFIAPALDPNTRTLAVRIEIKESGQGLRPGMFAQAVIAETDDGKRESVLAISEKATQLVEGELVVFVPVKGEEHTFAKRPVTVGRAVNGLLPVLSGLKEGESIVTNGSFILKAEHGKGSAAHEH